MDIEQMEQTIRTYMARYFPELIEGVPELRKDARRFWENTYHYFFHEFGERDYHDVGGLKWFARDVFFEERHRQYMGLMEQVIWELVCKVLSAPIPETLVIQSHEWANKIVRETRNAKLEYRKLYKLHAYNPELAAYYIYYRKIEIAEQEVSYACY